MPHTQELSHITSSFKIIFNQIEIEILLSTSHEVAPSLKISNPKHFNYFREGRKQKEKSEEKINNSSETKPLSKTFVIFNIQFFTISFENRIN